MKSDFDHTIDMCRQFISMRSVSRDFIFLMQKADDVSSDLLKIYDKLTSQEKEEVVTFLQMFSGENFTRRFLMWIDMD